MIPLRTRGYTLLEMIVSVGIFSVVMLFVTSAYLVIISMDKQSRGTNELTSNLAFAIESMARNVRTGTTYSCNGAGNGTCSQLSFFTSDATPVPITYLLKSDGTIGQCTTALCTDSTALSLTDSRITITQLTFIVRGVGTGDDTQPQVLMTVSGTMPTDAGKTTSFSIQTAATQRLIEL